MDNPTMIMKNGTALEPPPGPGKSLEVVRELARERFAPRAAHYDQTASFPSADFDDLFQAGLLGAAIPESYGGLGLGPYLGNVHDLWMMTKEIAKADLSLARCWEGHTNSLVLLTGMGSDEQKARWFEGVISRGETWVAWSGEPQALKPGESARYGTTVETVEGGYVVNGTKVFSLVEQAAAIYCMTGVHRNTVINLHPSAAWKTRCLDPESDIEDPAEGGPEAFLNCAKQIQVLVRKRFDEMGLKARA